MIKYQYQDLPLFFLFAHSASEYGKALLLLVIKEDVIFYSFFLRLPYGINFAYQVCN